MKKLNTFKNDSSLSLSKNKDSFSDKEKSKDKGKFKSKTLSRSLLLPVSNSNKKTLILDMDETLIHTKFQSNVTNYDIKLNVELEDNFYDIFVYKRPGVEEFLCRMSNLYELVIFTASIETVRSFYLISMQIK